MKNWYIVQSHSSFENKVASLIKEEADKAKISDKFEEIIVPTHDVTEVTLRSVVQLVERRSPKPEVVGSSPSAPAKTKKIYEKPIKIYSRS